MENSQNIRKNILKDKIHEIIFEADTPLGKYFDIFILVLIVLSVLVVMLESIESLQIEYANLFLYIEWIFTIAFTIEYALRIYCVRNPLKYATSFYGVVDLLAILPSYLSFLIAGTHSLMVIRALRLLRIFRIFKLGHYRSEGHVIIRAMAASRNKIAIFLFFITILIIIVGSVMYLVEGGNNPKFDSIPRSIYWAIVTLTTVGYGDISPETSLGQFLSAIVMILGYAVIAVPTGIVSSEFIKGDDSLKNNTQACRYCGQEGHDDDAAYCKYCGEILNETYDK